AWHLHLLFTRSYWEGLCGRVLGRPLHHTPTTGGPEERANFALQYERTRESYGRIFGSPPPADIWPPASVRFGRTRFRRTDVQRHWVLPKPGLGSSGARRTLALLAVVTIAASALATGPLGELVSGLSL